MTIPLAREQDDLGSIPGALPSPPQGESDSATNEISLLRDTHAGQKVAILGIEPDDARKHPLWGTISRYVTDWYGLELVSPTSDTKIDVILADKLPLTIKSDWSFEGRDQPVLVVSSKFVGHQSVRAEWSPFTKLVNVISRPCGPHKLARFIQKCLDRDVSTSDSQSPRPSTNPPAVLHEQSSSAEEYTPGNDNPSISDSNPLTPPDLSLIHI